MRSLLLLTSLAGLALGQTVPDIQPEAERLYQRATKALRNLPAYDLEVETTIAKPRGGDPIHILAKVAVREPDHVLISGTAPFSGESVFFSDGRTILYWQESTNQFTRIEGSADAAMALRLTGLTPEVEPVEKLATARLLRSEELDLEGDRFQCTVIEVTTAGRDGVPADGRPRTLWIDNGTGIALRQQTEVVPEFLEKEIPATIAVTRLKTGAEVRNGDFAFIVPDDATESDWRRLDIALTAHGLVGRPAPPLHLTGPDGRSLDMAKFVGRPVLIHFEAPWSTNSVEGDPGLDSLARSVGNDAKILRVRPVAAGGRGIAISDADILALGVKAWPSDLVLGRDGKILSFEAGRATDAALIALLRSAASPNATPTQPVWGPTELHKGGHAAKLPGDVTPPELTYRCEPEYTLEAQKARVAGTVMLSILISADGKVTDIQVLERLDPGLDARAISAVSRWRFTPAMRGTTPIAFRARAGVTFNRQ